ncbi:MAG: A24 family peptidase [Bacillota bacterium]|jgi:prepilin peptidase CpaA
MLQAITYLFLGIAVYLDLKENRIPNWLTVSAAGLGLVLQVTLNGLAGLGDSLGGFALGLLVLLPFFASGKFGGGDVKLLAALGALRGFHFFWRALLLGAAAGGALAVAVFIYHREVQLAAVSVITRTDLMQRKFPYSPAIAIGVILAELGWIL